MKAKKQRRGIEGGNKCPKCDRPMQRYEHNQNWAPKARQPYYFSYWDSCEKCRHVQHYEAAKVHLVEDPHISPAVIDQLRPTYVASGDRPPWED